MNSISTVEADADQSSVERALDEVSGHLNALHGRLIDLAAWLSQHPEAWQGDGVWTVPQYLTYRCGISISTAKKLVAVAERSVELPIAVGKVRAGELSLDQVTPIVRDVPAWADAQITSLATRLTVRQISHTVRRTDWECSPDAPAAPAAAETDASDEAGATGPADGDESGEPAVSECDDLNRVSYGHTDDGRWVLYANLDADLGSEVQASLDEARDAEFRAANHANESNALVPITAVEALAEVARRSLDAVPSVGRRSRYRINFHMALDMPMHDGEQRPLPDCLADLISCDGLIDPVFVSNARPVSVGRTQRIIPERTRRMVLLRDRHTCQVPGCGATHRLDLHHIVHWSIGGPTDTANLITLCGRHHRLHHKHRLGISGNADDPDSLEFTNRHGIPIRSSGAKPLVPTGPPEPIAGTYRRPIGERLDSRWVTFSNPAHPPGTEFQRSSQAG